MNNLRKLRRMQELTQAELGNLIGLSRQHIYNLEKGKNELTESMIRKICEVLECTADELLGIKKGD